MGRGPKIMDMSRNVWFRFDKRKKFPYEYSQSVAELMQRLGGVCSCRVSSPDWKKPFASLSDFRC